MEPSYGDDSSYYYLLHEISERRSGDCGGPRKKKDRTCRAVLGGRKFLEKREDVVEHSPAKKAPQGPSALG